MRGVNIVCSLYSWGSQPGEGAATHHLRAGWGFPGLVGEGWYSDHVSTFLYWYYCCCFPLFFTVLWNKKQPLSQTTSSVFFFWFSPMVGGGRGCVWGVRECLRGSLLQAEAEPQQLWPKDFFFFSPRRCVYFCFKKFMEFLLLSAFAAPFHSFCILRLVLQGPYFLCLFTQHPMDLQLSASLKKFENYFRDFLKEIIHYFCFKKRAGLCFSSMWEELSELSK